MCEIEIKDKNHKLAGLWLWDCKYSLDENSFSNEVKENIKELTGLTIGNLGDWWVSPNDNPIFYWEELINLALNILHCDATKLFVHTLHIEQLPEFKFTEFTGELPIKYCSGAKRVNAIAGSYTDHSESVGIVGLLNHLKGKEIEPKKVLMANDKFRLSGKDESCCVEGTWLDWCMFACNVLASKNTELTAPDLYAPTMSNENY